MYEILYTFQNHSELEICQANADLFIVHKVFTPLEERSNMWKEETAQGDNKSQAPLKFHAGNVKGKYR
jgi:hypothetical protein